MNTFGIGGSSIEAGLNAIVPNAHLVDPIQKDEFFTRIDKACKLMQVLKRQVMYLHAGGLTFTILQERDGVLANVWLVR